MTITILGPFNLYSFFWPTFQTVLHLQKTNYHIQNLPAGHINSNVLFTFVTTLETLFLD